MLRVWSLGVIVHMIRNLTHFFSLLLLNIYKNTRWIEYMVLGAPLETEERDLTRDEDVVVPIIKR